VASADLYGAVLTFLDDVYSAGSWSPGNLSTIIAAEQPGVFAAGSIQVARDSRSGKVLPRREPAPLNSIELVPKTQPRSRVVGIGTVERDVVVDCKITITKRDLSPGAVQATNAKDIARAIVQAFDQITSTTSLNISTSGATFVRCAAEIQEADAIPQSADSIRSIVRLTFTFIASLAINE